MSLEFALAAMLPVALAALAGSVRRNLRQAAELSAKQLEADRLRRVLKQRNSRSIGGRGTCRKCDG